VTLKKLVLLLTENAVLDPSNAGWIYKKMAQEFTFSVCDGLSIVVRSSWNFSHQGAMVTGSPYVFVRSKMVNTTEQSILGSAGIGIVSFIFHQNIGKSHGGRVSFIEFMVPEFEGLLSYSLSNEIPSYLNNVLKVSKDFVLQSFDMSSEVAFLRSLPSEFGLPSIYAGCGSLGWASFLLLRIMLGDEGATDRFQEKFAGNFFPRERETFDRIQHAKLTIPRL
jgi:hypothetical protein